MGDVEWRGVDDDDDQQEEEERIRQEFFAGKDSIIFLIDFSANMLKCPPDGGESPFQLSLRSIVSVMKTKIISSERDLLAVILFGTEQTKSDGFDHIYVMQELQQPSADFILALDKLLKDSKSAVKQFGHNNGFSLADALWQCSIVFARSKGKLCSRRVMLFTDEDHPHADSARLQRLSVQRANDLAESGIELDLMNINRHNTTFDVNSFYKDLIKLGDGEELPDASSKFEELLTQVRTKDHKKRSTAKLDLTLPGGISISVAVYNLVRPLTKPSPVKLDKASNEEVSTMTKKYLQETGELLLPNDIRFNQEFGGKKMFFDKDELAQMKQLFEPEIRLLGFKPRSCLANHHHCGPASFLYPEESRVQGSTQLFTALLQQCLQRQVVAICCATLRRSSGPIFAALLPQKEEKGENNVQAIPPGFHLIPLPFAEDFRELDVPADVVVPDEEQTAAAKAIMKKLKCSFNSVNFENPALQTHWRNIEALALDLAEPEPMIDCTLPNTEMIETRAGKLIAQFKSLVFPAGYAVGVSAAKRKVEKTGGASGDTKRIKVEVDEIERAVSGGQLAKLTVPVLKTYCTSVGIPTANRKKAEMIEDLNNRFRK